MKIHHCDENLSLRWKIYCCNENWSLDENLSFDENVSLWWNFFSEMKIHACDENVWLIENLSLWWKFIIGIKIFYFDERFISDEMKFITVMKFVILNCNQWEKNFLFDWHLEFNWTLLIVMKIYYLIKTHHCDTKM